MGKFVYKKRKISDVEKQIHGSNPARDLLVKEGFSFFTTKEEGSYQVRILPQTWNEEPIWFGIPFFAHYNVGGYGTFLSRHKMYQIPAVRAAHPTLTQEDPIREEIDRMLADGEKEAAEALYAGRSTLVWVIDRKNEDKGPQLWRMPYRSIDKQIGTIVFNENEHGNNKTAADALSVDCPDNGYDLIFTKEGSGRTGTKYNGVYLSRNATPLSTDAEKQARWLDHIVENPLPSVLNFPPLEKLRAATGRGETPAKDEVTAEIDTTPPAPESNFNTAREVGESDKPKSETAPPTSRPRPGQ